MNYLDSQLKEYFGEIKEGIVAPKEQKQKLISDLKENIAAYREDNPEASFKDITDAFGTADEICEYFLASLDEKPKRVATSPRPMIIFLVLIAVATILILIYIDVHTKQSNTNPSSTSTASVVGGESSELDVSGVSEIGNTVVSSDISDDTSDVEVAPTPDPYEIIPTDASFYILPESYLRNLTEEDIKELDKTSLMLARNEIYARHGRKFLDSDVQSYFDTQDWYKGTIEPEDFDDSTELSKIEERNITFLMKHQK